MNFFSRKATMGMLLSFSMLSLLIAKKDEKAVLDSINQKVSRINKILFPTSTSAATLLVASHNKNAVLDSINQKVSRINKSLPVQTPTYDYIVVGLGTAGATLARFLSDNFNNSVLVLEAGGNVSTDAIVQKSPATLTLHDRDVLTLDPRYAYNTGVIDDHNFGPNANNTNATTSISGPATGGGFEQFSTGRGWGGGSTHNFMGAFRGTPDIYNSWATISADGRWTYSNLLPYMKFMEKFNIPAANPAANLDTTQRGTTGALQITQGNIQTNTAVNQYYNFMADQMGCTNCNYISTGTDYNLPTQSLGVYVAQTYNTAEATPALRTRSSAVTAFLPATVVDVNGNGVGGRQLTIQSNATVDKVLFSGTTASGVLYVQNGVTKQANARRTIILCAGVFSPTILERSGIGDPAVLSAAGVSTFIANTNVGKFLRNHYGVQAAFPTPSYVPASGAGNGFAFFDGSVQAAATSVTGPNGPTGTFAPGISGFTAGQRNFEFVGTGAGPTQPSGLLQAVVWAANPPITYANYPRGLATITSWNLRPKSTGTVHIVNADPTVMPLIDFALYTDTGASGSGTDMEASAAMLNTINNIAAVNGLSLIYPSTADLQFPITNADVAVPNSSRKAAVIRSMLVNPVAVPNHYTGTCNMGTSIANGVVDGRLNVFGTTSESLKVADNSVAPLPETGNTAYQAYVIGLVAANILGQFSP
jgi:choline dehydrogenase